MAGVADASCPWADGSATYRPTASPTTRVAATSGQRNERVIAHSSNSEFGYVKRPARTSADPAGRAQNGPDPRPGKGTGRKTPLPIIRGPTGQRSPAGAIWRTVGEL